MNHQDKLTNAQNIPLKNISIRDKFFSEYIKLVKNVVIPYQWDALNDNIPGAEPSHAMKNFKIAAGAEKGEYFGMVFQDSDLAKWLEAAAYSLVSFPDEELEKTIDEVVGIIGKAQWDDGYINTYFTLKEPGKRWTNVYECHELYCAGHLIEAAVAYYEVTGKREFLDIMCKYADHIDSVFGNEQGKLRGYPGHPELELALVRLYRATGNEKYLRLSEYFVFERGKEPYYFEEERMKRGNSDFFTGSGIHRLGRKYVQTHLPVLEQTTAEGHSVRAVYLYSGMADVAIETGNRELMHACQVLWDNIQYQKMYIHGGIGAIARTEGFTGNYDLPNDTIYAETCASIGLIFFAKRMLGYERKSKYADVMERALYNLIIASMSADGRHFFYVNPLEVSPYAIDNDLSKNHVEYTRQKWFGCACCPPNVARLLSSLGKYIYSQKNALLAVDLYIGSKLDTEINGQPVSLSLESAMPYGGQNKITISCGDNVDFTLALRCPEWADSYTLKINGSETNDFELKDGYFYLKRAWNGGDTVEPCFLMHPLIVRANPAVHEDLHKVSVQRGPLVYCMEECDNGKNLSQLSIDVDSLKEEPSTMLERKSVTIHADALRTDLTENENKLYFFNRKPTVCKPVHVKFIPYYLWTNRTPGEMAVWFYEQPKADPHTT